MIFANTLHWLFAILMALIGLLMTLGGGLLIYLGGSPYYLAAGLSAIGVSVFTIRRSEKAFWVYTSLLFVTLVWSVFEAELEFLSLLPRLAMWLGFGLWFLTPWYRQSIAASGHDDAACPNRWWIGGPILASVLVLLIASLQGYVQNSEGTVRSHAGVPLAPTCTLTEPFEPDVIYVPALWRNPRPVLKANAALYPWLARHYARGAMIAGVGTGCCLMAEAGLLSGRSATTHWHYFDQFERAYPDVELRRDFFVTQSERLYCAASVNALADVTVHLIAMFFGHEVASHVERNFSHEIRKPYQSYRFVDRCDFLFRGIAFRE